MLDSTWSGIRVFTNGCHRQWDISLGPDIIGLESVAEVQVEGDRMFVDLPRRSEGSGPAVQVIYRRLE